jgi:hypothetical protein
MMKEGATGGGGVERVLATKEELKRRVVKKI